MTAPESAWGRYPEYRIDLVPCRGTARVRVGDLVVAESDQALRVIETDHVERLYFPIAAVRTDLMEPSVTSTVCPFKGRASYRSLAGVGGVDDLFWEYREPFPEVGGLAGHLGVYHEKPGVDVEIATCWADGAVSSCRFPAWGDQDDLIRLLDVQPVDGRFVAPGYHNRERNVVEGGQLAGQALVAAARTFPAQRPTWVAVNFARPATFDDEVDLRVVVARQGRTFSTVTVDAEQLGRLVAPALVLLDSGSPDAQRGEVSMRHAAAMPWVAGPDGSIPRDMGVIGRAVRVVDGAYDPDPDRMGPPEMHVWMRFRDNPGLVEMRQALLAQATTHWTVAAAMRPHAGFSEALAHVELSTGPVALSIAFHDDGPLDEWFLYSTQAVWSGRGLVQGEGRIFSDGGTLLATYSLQAMVRDLLPSAAGRDPSVVM